MKIMRKLLALVLAVMLVMSLATSALAVDITISEGAEGSQYAAYKLLNVTTSEAGEEGEEDDNFAYTLNDKYTAVLQAVTGKETEEEIIAYIGEQTGDKTRTFADAVYAAITVAGLAADCTAAGNVFAGVDQGYYLIAETVTGNEADTVSLVMLDTAGNNNITVKTKEDMPTVDKEVEEKNDSTGETAWAESADHDLNEKINYRITGTVSDKYASYQSYYYSFTDTMSAGLTYNGDAKVYVVNGETKTEVTEQFVIAPFTKEDTNETGFTATSNLKELTGVTVTADSLIVVEYTCTLNENAVIGAEGNPNKIVLEYENNPYHEADGDKNPTTPNEPEKPGKTPEDICIVFTFETVVNKVDAEGEALKGAGFTLYKWIADESEAGGAWVQIGEEIVGDDLTKFEFKRLDAGKYKLVETTIPAGYNKAEDVEFEIVAAYTEIAGTDGDMELTGLQVVKGEEILSEGEEASFSVAVTEGTVSTDIVNKSGVELPSTGGIGTTIFYVLGGILVLAAVVLLVTKKRMAN